MNSWTKRQMTVLVDKENTNSNSCLASLHSYSASNLSPKSFESTKKVKFQFAHFLA